MKNLSAVQMVQKRMAAKKANIHQNPGMKSNSPAGVAGTKRQSTIKAKITSGSGNVNQKLAAVKAGVKAKGQPKIGIKKSTLKNLPKPGKQIPAPTSYKGQITRTA